MSKHIHIPFTSGQSEAVDSKLIPQGLFTVAQNVRYAKDGRMVVRAAYRHDSAVLTTPKSPLGAAAFDSMRDICILPSSSLPTPQYLSYDHGAITTIYGSNIAEVGDLGVFEYVVADKSYPQTHIVSAIDSLVIGNVMYVVYCFTNFAATVPSSPLSVPAYLKRLNAKTGELLSLTTLSFGAWFPTNIKMTVNNGLICVYYAKSTTNEIHMSSYNATTLAIVTSDVTVATATTGRAPYFDISSGASSTETYLVYPSAASTLRFGTCTSAGVFTQLNTIATTSVEPRPSISATGLAPTDQVVIVWNDGATFVTGNFKYTVYRRSTTSFLIGTTSIYSGGDVFGYPVVNSDTVEDWVAACTTIDVTNNGIPPNVQFYSKTSSVLSTCSDMVLSSKPFSPVAGKRVVFTTTVSNGLTSMNMGGSYYAQMQYVTSAAFALLNSQSVTYNTQISKYLEPRRSVSVGVAAIGNEPGVSALLTALPILGTSYTGWAVFRSEYGGRAEMYQAAKLNGSLYFSGSRVSCYDGSELHTLGLPLPDQILESTAIAGNVPVGSYQVLAIWEWFDRSGKRHRSAPSLPFSTIVSPVPAGINVQVDCRPHGTYGLLGASEGQVTIRLYRTTLANATIFVDALGYSVPVPMGTTSLVIPITASDITIASNEALYTQGAQGGLSGVLQNDRPPGCRYIWAGSDRLIIGGLENPAEVWWSKVRTQGEPMNFTNFASFKAQVDGRVTAVAEMDGTWFVFTYNSVWAVSGQGPNDNGAGGSFDAPRRLPTDIGCISARSLLMTGHGLVFQGRNDCFYLLPRGGGAPQAIGWDVRDTLTAFPYVTASAYDQQSNVAYWSVVNTAASAGRVLVYDTRTVNPATGNPGVWFVDNPCNGRPVTSLSIYNSLLHLDGSFLEITGNYADYDGTTSTTVIPTITTGDIRPFGIEGRGRVRKAIILGECLDVTNPPTITMNVSYDSGKTYTDTSSWATLGTIASSVGDAIELEHMLQYPKGTAYRFQMSWTAAVATEGIAWHGLSLETYVAPGLSRLGPKNRV